MGWIHTVHKKGSWIVEVEGGGIARHHHTKEETVATGRELAIVRRTEHLIHHLDGTIAERNSYGSDPYPPRG
jgi:hypothetical protein